MADVQGPDSPGEVQQDVAVHVGQEGPRGAGGVNGGGVADPLGDGASRGAASSRERGPGTAVLRLIEDMI